MTILTLAELSGCSDTMEGKGYQKPIAYFKNYFDAELMYHDPRIHTQYGVQGTKTGIAVEMKSFNIFEHPNEFFAMQEEEFRAAALNKLTDAEKYALGLA